MAPKSKRNLILSISGLPSFVMIQSKNVQNGKENRSHFQCEKYDQLFDKLRASFNLKDVKACIFRTVEYELLSYPEAYEFRLKCREFCETNELFCCFREDFQLCVLAAVTNSKTMVKEGEEILVVVSSMPTDAGMIKLIREKDYYRIYDVEYCESFKDFTGKSLENFHPKKVVIFHCAFLNTVMDSINKYFKKYNPVIITQPEQKLSTDASFDNVLHLMGEKINPYYVTSMIPMQYKVCIGNTTLFTFPHYAALPFEESVVLDVNPSKSVTLHVGKLEAWAILEHISLSSFEAKKVKVTLKLDINAFYNFNVEPINDDLGENLSNLNISTKLEKVRIIFDKQTFSVVGYADGGKKYKISDSDGLDKTPLYIAFTEKKPIVGESAKEAYNKNPESVVFDLIKLCSITSSDVMNPQWIFRLTKENDVITVIVQTVEGERQSSVEFLMALILRNVVKRILKETGEKVSEVEVVYHGFSPNETLKKTFVEAGKLMECEIVFVDDDC